MEKGIEERKWSGEVIDEIVDNETRGGEKEEERESNKGVRRRPRQRKIRREFECIQTHTHIYVYTHTHTISPLLPVCALEIPDPDPASDL